MSDLPQGVGRIVGLLGVDYPADWFQLSCSECGASWYGPDGEPCKWCANANAAVVEDQAQLDRRHGRRRLQAVPDAPDGEPPAPPPSGPQRAPRPVIKANDRQLESLADEILDALTGWNDPPSIFVRGGSLCRVRPDEEGRPRIEVMSGVMLRGMAARAAAFVSIRRTTDGDERRKPCFPPKDAVHELLERGEWPWPQLRAVTAAPIVRPDGTIHTDHGYDPATGYYHWSPHGPVDPIPMDPTVEERQVAATMIHEALADFPFETDADRANAWAFLLTPLVRPLLDAVPPMALIDAPQPGTGKGLLVKLMSVIGFGDVQPMTALPERDEEFAKQLTAYLLAGQPLVVLDNVEKPLRSPTLAAALTTNPYQGRILGVSSAPIVPNQAIYVATGNNVSVAGDLARRSYRVRLNAAAPHPDRRTEFRHDPLLPWARAFRPQLLWSLCVMVRAWWQAGQPPDTTAPALGESTPWVRMVGGILAHAGVTGFLTNTDQVRADTDVEEDEWATFMATWASLLGERAVTAHELTTELEREATFRSTMPGRLAGAWERSNWATALGSSLRSRLGRYHGLEGWHFTRHGKDRVGRALWAVATHATTH